MNGSASLKKCDDWKRRTGYFHQRKKVKTKFIYMDDAGNDKLLHWLLLSLASWLMLARWLCVYNADLKVDATREILTVVMMSYYENVRSCKTHSSLSCVLFLVIPFALSGPHDSLPWVLICYVRMQSTALSMLEIFNSSRNVLWPPC